MQVPILKQGDCLIASVQSSLMDADLVRLRNDLMEMAGRYRSRGVVIDVTVLDVMDSFACRILLGVTQSLRLRGADTVVVGIQPDVAFAMVQLGLSLEGVTTLLDLDEAISYLNQKKHRGE
jgi:rsbT antagonist protein RsbS